MSTRPVTSVLATAFTATDWWEEPEHTDPWDAPGEWTKFLRIVVPTTPTTDPVTLELTADNRNPEPVLEMTSYGLDRTDLAALATALPHVLEVLDQISEEVSR